MHSYINTGRQNVYLSEKYLKRNRSENVRKFSRFFLNFPKMRKMNILLIYLYQNMRKEIHNLHLI